MKPQNGVREGLLNRVQGTAAKVEQLKYGTGRYSPLTWRFQYTYPKEDARVTILSRIEANCIASP